jgi:hypothetical protein
VGSHIHLRDWREHCRCAAEAGAVSAVKVADVVVAAAAHGRHFIGAELLANGEVLDHPCFHGNSLKGWWTSMVGVLFVGLAEHIAGTLPGFGRQGNGVKWCWKHIKTGGSM